MEVVRFLGIFHLGDLTHKKKTMTVFEDIVAILRINFFKNSLSVKSVWAGREFYCICYKLLFDFLYFTPKLLAFLLFK